MRYSVGRRLAAAVPSVIVAAPLVGFAFQLDQRRAVYRSAAEGLVNPLSAVRHALDGIDDYLSRGNFRPIGRFLEAISDGFIFETAVATGIPPNVVHGMIRIAMVGLLAMVPHRGVGPSSRSLRIRDGRSGSQLHADGPGCRDRSRGHRRGQASLSLDRVCP